MEVKVVGILARESAEDKIVMLMTVIMTTKMMSNTHKLFNRITK